MAVHLLTLVAILPPLALDRLITGRIRGIFDFPVARWTAKHSPRNISPVSPENLAPRTPS